MMVKANPYIVTNQSVTRYTKSITSTHAFPFNGLNMEKLFDLLENLENLPIATRCASMDIIFKFQRKIDVRNVFRPKKFDVRKVLKTK